jgi:hypothetical protein
LHQGGAQVEPGLDGVRLELQGFLEMRHGFRGPPLLEQQFAQVVEGHEGLGIALEGGPPERFGVGVHVALAPGEGGEGEEQSGAEQR